MAEPHKLYGMHLSVQRNDGSFVPVRAIEPPKIAKGSYEISGTGFVDPGELEKLRPFADEQAKVHADRLQAETDRWCWKAIAQGVGNRVWRSAPEMDDRTFVVSYRFAILKPGQAAPGSGMVFGPFSKS